MNPREPLHLKRGSGIYTKWPAAITVLLWVPLLREAARRRIHWYILTGSLLRARRCGKQLRYPARRHIRMTSGEIGWPKLLLKSNKKFQIWIFDNLIWFFLSHWQRSPPTHTMNQCGIVSSSTKTVSLHFRRVTIRSVNVSLIRIGNYIIKPPGINLCFCLVQSAAGGRFIALPLFRT